MQPYVSPETAAAMVKRAMPGPALQVLAVVGAVAAGKWVWDHRDEIAAGFRDAFQRPEQQHVALPASGPVGYAALSGYGYQSQYASLSEQYASLSDLLVGVVRNQG